MASKEGPVASVSSDGLPAGLVILSDESVPIELHSQLGQEAGAHLQHSLDQSEGRVGVSNVDDDPSQNDVDFCESVQSHGITMVEGLSQFGGNLDESDRIDDTAIIRWLQEVLMEDHYGKIDCKVMKDLIQKEFGDKKRKTRAWVKRAFPCSYLRRSDRNRWFCGVSFRSDEGKSAISNKDKDWIDKAVFWLTNSIEVNPNAKERCSDVHHALTEYVGQASVHMAISAVKMVFPNIPRKTFARIAFYVGIQFKDPSLGHFSAQSAANNLSYLSDIKTEYSDSAANKLVVAWLQKALIADETKKEPTELISMMIKKRFGKTLPLNKVARLVKKGYPNITVKSRGASGGVIWGVRIDDAYRPTTKWMEKAVKWIQELYEPAELSYCEHASQLFNLLYEKLGLEKQSKAVSFLQQAFPKIQYKEIMDCQMILGIKQKKNIEEVEAPEFTKEELSVNQEIFLCLDGKSTTNESFVKKIPEEPAQNIHFSTAVTSTPASQTVTPSTWNLHDYEPQRKSSAILESKIAAVEQNLKSFQGLAQEEFSKLNTKVSQLDGNISTMTKDITHIKDEISKLIKDNAKSAQQKDALIIQLQQTLIMLCQQQLQKFIPGDQNFPEQTLSTLLQKGLVNQNDSSDT